MKINIQGHNTLVPYKTIQYHGIQYAFCRDFDHISRYRGLRQIIHGPNDRNRSMTLEVPNPFHSTAEVYYYKVPYQERNRLDIIANKLLGSARYAWIIAYFNRIEDGFTVNEDQKLAVPKKFTSLFNSGEVLASVPVNILNLGYE